MEKYKWYALQFGRSLYFINKYSYKMLNQAMMVIGFLFFIGISVASEYPLTLKRFSSVDFNMFTLYVFNILLVLFLVFIIIKIQFPSNTLKVKGGSAYQIIHLILAILRLQMVRLPGDISVHMFSQLMICFIAHICFYAFEHFFHYSWEDGTYLSNARKEVN